MALSSNSSEIKGKLAWMESEVRRTLASRCSIQVQGMATYIQTVWWPHIQYLMRRIPVEEQKEVTNFYTQLQYMLGLVVMQYISNLTILIDFLHHIVNVSVSGNANRPMKLFIGDVALQSEPEIEILALKISNSTIKRTIRVIAIANKEDPANKTDSFT